MDKPEHILLRRRKKPEIEHEDVMSVYNDARWPVPHDYPPKPPHCHHHHGDEEGGSEDCVPVPVETGNIKIGPGLRLDGNVVSVKIDNRGVPGLTVSDKGLSASALAKKVEWQGKKIDELAEIILDLKNQINKLKAALSPASIAKIIAESSTSFIPDDKGRITVNVGKGLVKSSSGVISVDAGIGLKFEDDGNKLAIDNEKTIAVNGNSFGVNVDDDTIRVNSSGQIESTADTNWGEYTTI